MVKPSILDSSVTIAIQGSRLGLARGWMSRAGWERYSEEEEGVHAVTSTTYARGTHAKRAETRHSPGSVRREQDKTDDG